MKRIQGAYEKIGDAQEQKIAIVQESTWIPGKHEYTDGNDDAEKFGDAVEEEVVIQARKVKPEQNEYAKKWRQDPFCFSHRDFPSQRNQASSSSAAHFWQNLAFSRF